MELLLIIAGITLLILYRKVIKANAVGTEQKARRWAEDTVMDAQLEREQAVDDFKEEMKQQKKVDTFEEVSLTSSEDVFKLVKIDI